MDAAPPSANVAVVALNFTPGHYSHVAATCSLLEEAGHQPVMAVHEGFARMDTQRRWPKVHDIDALRKLPALSAAVFWSPSLKNIGAMLRLRARGVRIAYVLHEPFDSIASYRRGGFGWLRVARILLISLAQLPMVRLAHTVVLPSDKSLALYEQRYRWLNAYGLRLPLLFDDEAAEQEPSQNTKDAVSYIGTIAEDHAFEDYLRFVEQAIRQQWLPGLRFAIVTRSVLAADVQVRIDKLTASGRLFVQSGQPLSNEAINNAYRSSLVVWNAYRRSNQSGVLPKAYMFGAAVLIATGMNNEFVDLGRTAEAVNAEEPASVAAAIERIQARAADAVSACRERFLTTFHQRRHASAWLALLGFAPQTAPAP